MKAANGPIPQTAAEAGAGPIRLLTFSTLFPNCERPNHGIFVETRLRFLIASGAATSVVVAPVPFFPWAARRFGTWGAHARTPRREERYGQQIWHPRYPVIPAIGMSAAPLLLYRAVLPFAKQLLGQLGGVDAIDAHYVYPDGVAAIWLGRRFGLPVVITARGTDVNLLPRYAVPRRLIRQAITGAAAMIAVSAALKEALVELGASAEHVTVLRNGVDIAAFRLPLNRDALRSKLGLSGPTLISVGHLIERKGHDLVVEAMTRLPHAELLIVGDGPERECLARLIAERGLARQIRLLGARPHAEMPALYGAADVLVLASSREGWANVLLEAMACGTPVVASNVWGNPEVVRSPAAGMLAESRTPEGIADAVKRLLAQPPDRVATRRYAEGLSWNATTGGQLQLFRRVIAGRSSATSKLF